MYLIGGGSFVTSDYVAMVLFHNVTGKVYVLGRSYLHCHFCGVLLLFVRTLLVLYYILSVLCRNDIYLD